MSEEFAKNLMDVGRKFSNVVFLSERDCELNSTVEKFFPGRLFNFGLSKRNLVMVAVGFCLRGKLPVIMVRGGFVEEVFAEMKKTVDLPNLNIKFVSYGGEENSSDGELIELMRNVNAYEVSDLGKMMEEYGPGYLRVL